MANAFCNVYTLPGYTVSNLRAQLYTSGDVASGAAISTGFYASTGTRGKVKHVLTTADDFIGWCEVYDIGDATEILAVIPINPQEVNPALVVWNALTAGMTVVGSIGKLIVDNLNVALSVIQTAIAALNNLSSTQAQTAAAAALTAYNPPTFAQLDARTDAIDAAIASIQSDTNDLQIQIGSAGDGLTALPPASVDQQDIIDALTTYDVATADDLDCAGDGKIEFTYTLTSVATGQPIPGATIRFTSDSAGLNTLWTGTTDVLGVARNLCGDKPRLDAGTVFVFRSHPSFVFAPEPDTESIS